MSNVDIVARLQLRADQFSSETGARFAELRARAKSAAQEIRSNFTSSLADVSKIAQQALTLPRTTTGALDLSGEINALRQAASASDARATSLREMQQAMLAAAAAGRGNIEMLRQDADAAMVAAANEERLASEARQRIVTLGAVQQQMRASSVTTQELTRAGAAHVVSAGQQRAAMQNLGFQFQDFTVQVASGQSAFVAFAQQFPQAAGALTGFGGRLGAMGAALSSFGGIAAIVAVTAITPLIAKLLESGDATEKLIKKLREDALESRRAADAKRIYEQSLDGVIEKQRALNEELAREVKTRNEIDQGRLDQTRESLSQYQTEIEKQRDVIALARRNRDTARERVEASGAGSREANVTRALRAETEFNAAVRRGTELIKERDAAREAERNAQIPLLRRQVAEATDEAAAATGRYDRALERLNDQFRKRQISEAEYRRRLATEENQLEAAKKAARAGEQASKRGPLTPFLSPIAGRQTGAFGERRPGHTHAGVDIAAPVGTPVRATATGAIEFAGKRGDYGNLIIVNNGAGTSTRFAHLSRIGAKAGDRVDAGDIIGYSGGRPGTDGAGRSTGAHLHYEVRRNGRAVDPSTGRFPTDEGQVADATARAQEKAERAADKVARANEAAADAVERINITWDEQPRLIERARLDAARLSDIIADYEGKPDEASKAIVAAARASMDVIEQGLDRPYQLFVRNQREGLAIQQLILAGRDVEAAALQDALRLQEAGQALDDRRLANLYAMAEQQRAIAIALEDQRRIVGAYVGSVGDLQRTFDDFMVNVERKPGKALEQLLTGTAETFKQLQRNLLSESIFGGLDRKVEEYVRRRTGGTTPADMLREQLGQAGRVLDSHVDQTGAALDDFVAMVRRTTDALGIASSRGIGAPSAASLVSPDLSEEIIGALRDRPATGIAANDNEGAEVIVTASRSVAQAANVLGDKAGLAGIVVDHFADRLKQLGVEVPKNITDALKTALPTVIDGLNFGQAGGSIFASITGGKDDKLASGVGGILGNVAGKALKDPISAAIGGSLGKAFGSAAGPLGSIVGGIAGNLVGSLFRSNKYGSATVSFGQYGEAVASNGMGRGQDQTRAASGSARSVAQGVNRIAEQLGATITSLPGITLGNWNGNARVALTSTNRALHSNNFSSAVLKDFGKDGEQEAIEYAIRYSISNAVLSGISQASKNIIARGSNDLESAINKAVLIESVPKALKERLDPVGAAVDAVELRFKRIFDVLKEGGATADQIAQAQKLYNLELDDAKTKTNTAAASLKQFLDGLRAGNASPLSLRDQQISARAALQPYLDKISAGQAIDQDKYQSAAQTFLDIERQLYGSTNAFFVEFDRIQKATAKAIERVDGVSALPNADVLARATAESTAKAAAAAQTGNEMAERTNDLLTRLVDLNTQLLTRAGNGGGSSFIGERRGFTANAA